MPKNLNNGPFDISKPEAVRPLVNMEAGFDEPMPKGYMKILI